MSKSLPQLSGPRSYRIFVCPECREQETHYADNENRPTTYCLNHEDEPGRKHRPEHLPIAVIPKRRGEFS